MPQISYGSIAILHDSAWHVAEGLLLL